MISHQNYSNGRLPTSSSSGSLNREPTPNQSSLFNSNNSNTGRTNFSKSKATLENLFGGQTSTPSFSSNSNISSINQQEPQQQYVQSQPDPPQSVTKPNYHKPNLAPKPPGQNGNPVARHQSMRTPKYVFCSRNSP